MAASDAALACQHREVLPELVDVVGPHHVLTAPDEVAPYCTDFSGRYRGATVAVVQPGTVDEVAGVVRLCRREGVAVVPQGGNTGLVGGGVPVDGEVVVSLRRLDGAEGVRPEAGHWTGGAGVALGAVHEAAAAAGWAYGVDFASRDAATVGGTIATNAGGLRVLRYGDTRAQVIGVEAVLGDGSVVSHLGGLVKDNTGYHLPSLLCGSEGTLGIVTAATLRLVPPPERRITSLLAFDSVDRAVQAAYDLRRDVRTLEAAELFLASGLDLVCRVCGLPSPFATPHAAYLVVEAAEDVRAVGAADAVSVAGAAERAGLWRYREGHTRAVNTLGAPHKFDVTLPPPALAEFMHAVAPVVEAAAPVPVRTWMWGHAADGNVHVNVTGLAPEEERVDEAVLRLVAALGGSISAEHGIGRAKRAWLGLNRSDAEVAAFRAIKRALDPDGILNPNVLLP